MRIKRIISLIIGTTLMLSTTVPVIAFTGVSMTSTATSIGRSESPRETESKDVKITKENAKKIAIKKVKDFFEIIIDEKVFEFDGNLESYIGINSHPEWFLHWRMHNDKKGMNISVQIDAMNGNILSADYNEYDNDRDIEKISTITREEAAEIAKAFVKKYHPNEYKQLKLSEDNNIYYNRYRSNTYHFNYYREMNSIPYSTNSIVIGVDGVTGKVISYRWNWDVDAVFPKQDGIVDQQTAEDTFKQNTKMTLKYVPVEGEDSYSQIVKEVKLAYDIDYINNTNMVDAIKNNMIDMSSETNFSTKTKDLTAEQKQKLQKAVKTSSKNNKAIDERRAMEVIQKLKDQFYDEKLEINKVELIEDPTDWQSKGRKVWSGQVVKREGNSAQYFDGIIIDAFTEKLVAINNYAIDWTEKEFAPKLTWEEAYDQAAKLLIEYFPEQAKQVKTEQTYIDYALTDEEKTLPPRRYSFYFPRIVRGLEYPQDSISVGFDTETGQLTELRCHWSENLVFPDPSKVISSETAKQSYFDAHTPQLCYRNIMGDQNIEASAQSQIQLVYILQPDPPNTFINGIDAVSGKPIDYKGYEITKGKPDFTQKIKNHPNKKQLQILASSGIIDPETFVLDQDISMIEWIKMLVNAKGYRPYIVKQEDELKFTNINKTHENYHYLQMAVYYGFIENKNEAFDSEAKITREQIAKMLIQMLEYNDLAKMNNVFAVDLTDAEQIDPDFLGSIAIAKGLGIFEDSTFRPKDRATYVECALSIYKALQ